MKDDNKNKQFGGIIEALINPEVMSGLKGYQSDLLTNMPNNPMAAFMGNMDLDLMGLGMKNSAMAQDNSRRFQLQSYFDPTTEKNLSKYRTGPSIFKSGGKARKVPTTALQSLTPLMQQGGGIQMAGTPFAGFSMFNPNPPQAAIVPGDTVDMSTTPVPLQLLGDNGQSIVVPPFSGQTKIPGAGAVLEVPTQQQGGPMAQESTNVAPSLLSTPDDSDLWSIWNDTFNDINNKQTLSRYHNSVASPKMSPFMGKNINEIKKNNEYFINFLQFTNDKEREAITQASKTTGIPEEVIWTNILAEGGDLFLKDRQQGHGVNLFENPEYIDGFQYFGFDTLGDQVGNLQRKGLLSKNLDYNVQKVTNEKQEHVNSLNPKTFLDAIHISAAALKDNRNFIDKNHKNLSEEQKKFFTYASYITGRGNVNKMIKSFRSKGLLDNDDFIDTYEGKDWSQPFRYTKRRYNKLRKMDEFFKLQKGGTVESPYEWMVTSEDDKVLREMFVPYKEYKEGGKVGTGNVVIPVTYKDGGIVYYEVPHAFLGGLFKGIGKGIGSVGKAVGKGLGKVAGAVSDVAGFAAPFAGFIPGIGAALGPALGAVGGIGDYFQGGQQGGIKGLLGNVIGGGVSGFGGFGKGASTALKTIGNFVKPVGGQIAGSLMAPSQPQMGGYGTAPFMGGMAGLGSLFSMLGGLQGLGGGMSPLFQLGGPVEQPVPIQAELGELVAMKDLSLVNVKADQLHKQMDKDEITDAIPSGSYVFSADDKMKIKLKDVEDYSLGFTPYEYSEHEKGDPPKEIMFSDIFKNDKELTPAQIADRIRMKYPTLPEERLKDPFSKITSIENKQARAPWIEMLIDVSEQKRTKRYKKGGVVGEPVKAQKGRDFGYYGQQNDLALDPYLNDVPVYFNPNTGNELWASTIDGSTLPGPALDTQGMRTGQEIQLGETSAPTYTVTPDPNQSVLDAMGLVGVMGEDPTTPTYDDAMYQGDPVNPWANVGLGAGMGAALGIPMAYMGKRQIDSTFGDINSIINNTALGQSLGAVGDSLFANTKTMLQDPRVIAPDREAQLQAIRSMTDQVPQSIVNSAMNNIQASTNALANPLFSQASNFGQAANAAAALQANALGQQNDLARQFALQNVNLDNAQKQALAQQLGLMAGEEANAFNQTRANRNKMLSTLSSPLQPLSQIAGQQGQSQIQSRLSELNTRQANRQSLIDTIFGGATLGANVNAVQANQANQQSSFLQQLLPTIFASVPGLFQKQNGQ